MDASIRQAIAEKRLVEFEYQGHHRVCEPHVYGRHSDCDQLLVYQVDGSSKSGRLPDRRRVRLTEVEDMRVLDQPFPGARPCPSGIHSSWDQIYVIVA